MTLRFTLCRRDDAMPCSAINFALVLRVLEMLMQTKECEHPRGVTVLFENVNK